MKFTRWAWLLLLLPLPLLALACGDGGGPATATPTPTAEPREMTADDLPSLVLTAEEVGEVFPDLAPITQEGATLQSNEEAIQAAVDPETMRAAIQKYGRVTGYQATYHTREATYLARTDGQLAFMQVELFETAEGASGFLDEQQGLAALLGETEGFEAGDIGDEAQGLTIRLSYLPGISATGITVRVDRVMAAVSVLHGRDEDVREEARQLATVVAERIEAQSGGLSQG